MSAGAAPGARRVALVTCAEARTPDADTSALLPLLAARGIDASPQVWDDPRVDWARFDLAIVRSCWDYHVRRDEFLAWATRVPALANPASVLAWNTDKRYLRDLEARAVPVVPTTWIAAGDRRRESGFLPDGGLCVVKPAVSLACLSTGRYDVGDPAQRSLAAQHVRRLRAVGQTVMIQPYMGAIDTDGETSMVFIDGAFSHAMRKGALLDGPDTQVDRRFAPQGGIDLRPRWPTTRELELAARALDAVPAPRHGLLYARVDTVPDERGEPMVLEVELTEPQLYLGLVPDAARRLADRIVDRIRRAPMRGAA